MSFSALYVSHIFLTVGSICVVVGLALLAMAIWGVISKSTDIWVPIVFGVFGLIGLACALRCFFTLKPRQKDDDKTVSFIFYEYGLQVR